MSIVWLVRFHERGYRGSAYRDWAVYENRSAAEHEMKNCIDPGWTSRLYRIDFSGVSPVAEHNEPGLEDES